MTENFWTKFTGIHKETENRENIIKLLTLSNACKINTNPGNIYQHLIIKPKKFHIWCEFKLELKAYAHQDI